MVRSRLGDRLYVLVNRNQILPARPEASAPAPELIEWEGQRPGILRDTRGERYVRLETAAFQSLFSAATRARIDPQPLFDAWGFEFGRVTIIDLETLMLERQGVSLRVASLGDTLALLCHHIEAQGWGSLSLDFQHIQHTGVLLARLHHAALLGALRCPPAQRHAFHEGYLRAILSHLAARRMAARHLPEPGLEDPETTGTYLLFDEARLPELNPLLLAPEATIPGLLDHLLQTPAP
jgi:hypothetical protein